MPRRFASKRLVGGGARVALLAAGAALAGQGAHAARAAEVAAPTFEATFAVKGEPAALYYTVAFVGADGPHTLQVWRDGQARLRRRTDDLTDTYVLRASSDPHGYQMIVVDYRKRITTRINRDSLVRLGHFSDWFDLAHGLRHPAGPYQLTASQRPEKAPAPIGPCAWYELRQADSAYRVCWSARDRLPLVIWSELKGAAVWRVTAVERKPIADDIFQLHDTGFVHNDADEDIDND